VGQHYLYAREGIKDIDSIGAQIVYQACGKPFEQILINAGYSSTDAQMIGKYRLVESGNDIWAGYNLKTKEVVNMKEAGIIDPTKVTRTALENAASVAGMLLLTECTLVPYPKEKEDTPSMGMGF
jgi:chaperonin GroEL